MQSDFLNYSYLMAIENILAQIDSEISGLKQARKLLATIGTAATKAGRKAAKASAKPSPGRSAF